MWKVLLLFTIIAHYLNYLTIYFSVGCSIVEALEAATLHPATTLGIENTKGVLNYGADADIVMLNKDLELLSTWISGECVHCNYKCNEHCQ